MKTTPLAVVLALAAPASMPEAAMPAPSPRIARRDLLTAHVSPERPLASVQVQEVTLQAGQPVPLHLHP